MKFNDILDFSTYKSAYQAEQRIRISNVFSKEDAHQIKALIEATNDFRYALVKDNEVISIKPEDFNLLTESQKKDVISNLMEQARRGIGFFYGKRTLYPADHQSASPLSKVYEWLNSSEVIEQIKSISGDTSIVSANAQATCYEPGHFLTRHKDVAPNEGRKLAYVIGLTEGWHPDWGGLLQFFQPDGTPTVSFSPTFNSMSLFSVEHVHSVTYVPPFAGKRRFSITGWFCDKPQPK